MHSFLQMEERPPDNAGRAPTSQGNAADRRVEQYCEEAIVAVLIMDETDRNADEDEIH